MPSTPFANRPANRSRTLHQVAIHASATIPQFSRGSLTNSRTTLVHLTTPPTPKPGPPRQPNHSPSLKSPQITVQTTPVQTPAPPHPKTPVHAQITAHPQNPPKSQFRHRQSRHPPHPTPKLPSTRKSQPIHKIPPNHSPSTKSPRQSRHPPHPTPKLPSTRKSQPIHKIPPNHSPDNASPDTRPSPPQNSRPRANHSPSTKSPQIPVQTTPVQTPAPPHPKTPVHAQNHSPSLKSPQITVQTVPQPATYATTKNEKRKTALLDKHPNYWHNSPGFTVQEMAFTTTCVAGRLVSPSAAQDDIHHDPNAYMPACSTTTCLPNFAVLRRPLSVPSGQSPVPAHQVELFLPFSRLMASDIIRVDRISCT